MIYNVTFAGKTLPKEVVTRYTEGVKGPIKEGLVKTEAELLKNAEGKIQDIYTSGREVIGNKTAGGDDLAKAYRASRGIPEPNAK